LKETVLLARDLHKIYNGKVHAVKGISFKVVKGEIFGLIGPNGAGKTTTLRMIATPLKPTRGEILVTDINITMNEDLQADIRFR
jgi:ABC-2 type transport system ATP-binding protein